MTPTRTTTPTSMTTTPSHVPGLDRDGHLSELAIDHYLCGDPGPRPEIDRHLAACAPCKALIAAVQADDGALAVPRPPAPIKERPARHRLVVASSVFAMAAVVTLVVAPWRSSPPLEGERFLARGSALSFTVHLHDGITSRAIDPGAVVRAGDRARFEVTLAEDGYLFVAGLDDRGEAYAGYPQEGAAAAVFMSRSLTPIALPTAIVFDDSAGREHLFAMLCDRPFAQGEMVDAMRASLRTGDGVASPPGCTLRRVDLDKRAP